MNKEESFEDWWKRQKEIAELEMGEMPELHCNFVLKNMCESSYKEAWNHQAKKIEALEKENEDLKRPLGVYREVLPVTRDSLKECQRENKNLIAALKKAEEFMLDISLPNSKRVPSPRMGSALKFLDSPEYQAIKHLLEDNEKTT